nr:hypothetical protein [Tanacetum cinerariifolium]
PSSAAVNFKNHVKTRWGTSTAAPIPDAEKDQIKQLIVRLMLSAGPKIQAQLSEAIAVIGNHDSTLKKSLLPELKKSLKNAINVNDFVSVNVRAVENLSVTMSVAGGDIVVFKQLVEAQRLCCRIFYSLNFLDLPEFFEDNADKWMNEFKNYLTVRYPVVEDSGADGLALVDGLRVAVCDNISYYMEKKELFQKYLSGFVEAVWSLLVVASVSLSRERLTVTAIKFLTIVSTSVYHALFAGDEILQQITQSIVIPNVMLREEDEERFEMNYIEFIRRDMEGSDLDTRRRIACELLRGLLDCAIYLVVFLATKKGGGASVSTDLVDVDSFFRTIIMPELQGQDVNAFPMLKAALMTNLFGALKKPESEENQYIMRCIMRVLQIADISPEVASPCITGLTTVLNRPLNNALLPSLEMILGKEVAEFFPYAFQLLAQLVDLNRPPVPPRYMQIFDILLTPDLWKKSANVPALVRLHQSFLQQAPTELTREGKLRNMLGIFNKLAPTELTREGKLRNMLGIFNKLVSSSSTEEQGFHILNPVIENLGYDVLAEYMNHIWATLFTRLQNNKTPRLVRCLIIFMSLFLVKQGAHTLVDSVNSVQANLFNAILGQFWIPTLKTITGNTEVKLSAVASAKLLCESPSLLDPAAEELWGKLLDGIVTLLSQPEEQRVEDEPEVPDFGEATGYKPPLFVFTMLFRGRFPPVITGYLSQANQAALLQLCNSYKLAIFYIIFSIQGARVSGLPVQVATSVVRVFKSTRRWSVGLSLCAGSPAVQVAAPVVRLLWVQVEFISGQCIKFRVFRDENDGKVDEGQTRVVSEYVNEVRDVNESIKENYYVGKTGMDNEMDDTEDIHGISIQKDEKEGNKASYAKIASKASLDNKLKLIPTEINEDGTEVILFDEDIVSEGSKKWELTVKLRNLPLKASTTKGISDMARRLGTPLIMDQITTNMCRVGNGRVGFARVLIDVEAVKGLPDKIEIVYKNKDGLVTGKKSVDVNYDWAPPMCFFCKELEAHYMYMAQLQEVSSDTADFGPIFDDEPVKKVKLRNLPLKSWTTKGISDVARRLGTPLIMDQITTNMCRVGNGRVGFARVLIDVEAVKGLPYKIKRVYKNKDGLVTGKKSVDVNYDWAPHMCSFYKQSNDSWIWKRLLDLGSVWSWPNEWFLKYPILSQSMYPILITKMRISWYGEQIMGILKPFLVIKLERTSELLMGMYNGGKSSGSLKIFLDKHLFYGWQ